MNPQTGRLVDALLRHALLVKFGKIVATLQVEFTVRDGQVTGWEITDRQVRMKLTDVSPEVVTE